MLKIYCNAGFDAEGRKAVERSRAESGLIFLAGGFVKSVEKPVPGTGYTVFGIRPKGVQ